MRKRAFLAAVLAFVIFSSTALFAQEMHYGVSVTFDGQVVHFSADSEPFIMGDRTFLPLAAIANLLGIEIGFDESTTTVMLGGTGGGAGQEPVAQPAPVAQPEPVAQPTPTAAGGAFTPGSYDVSGSGFGGTIYMTVVFDANGIVEIDVTDHSESPGFWDMAWPAIGELIVSSNTADVSLDAFSGATVSSEAIVSGVRDAIAAATAGGGGGGGGNDAAPTEAAGRFTPGSYNVSVGGFGGNIDMTVVLDGDGIVDVIVNDHDETPAFWNRVWPDLGELIVDSQTANVSLDAFSGATVSSEAVVAGVRQAMVEAGESNPDNQ